MTNKEQAIDEGALTKEAIEVVFNYIAIAVPYDEMKRLLRSDKHLLGDLAEYGVSDTENRELLCDMVTMDLVGRRVPKYGESRKGFNAPAFLAEVQAEAKKRNWV